MKSKKNRPSIYIDFRKFTENEIKNTESIYFHILEELNNKYKNLNLNSRGVLEQIYRKEINDCKNGIWKGYDSNKIQDKICEYLEKKTTTYSFHLEKISKYLLNSGKVIIIIFDNVDQLSDESQKDIFILSQSINAKIKCISIISLREGYYYKNKNSPPFDAYHSTIFHISAPRFSEVIQRRIQYVLDKLDISKVTQGDYQGKSIKIAPEAIKRLFTNLNFTIFNEKQSDILSFLEHTSYPNISLGIEKINKFLISGHTNIIKYTHSSDFKIPIWEFVKPIALESRRYYHSEESDLFNLLKPSRNNKNHFTKIKILNYLASICNEKIHKDEYISVESVINFFLKQSYSEEIIFEEINILIKSRFIEVSNYFSDIDNDNSFNIDKKYGIKITYCGLYYIRKILSEFYYLDLVLQDTPIFINEYFDKIKASFPRFGSNENSNIISRCNTIEIFIAYLQSCENYEFKQKSDYLDSNIVSSIAEKDIYNSKLKNRLQSLKDKFIRVTP